MRAVIIGNGSISDYDYIRGFIGQDDFIICADGGIRHAIQLGLKADVLIGDFDSMDNSQKSAAQIIEYPKRKDFTDGELAVDYAAEHGFSDILMIGMTGTRLDHTINNILLLFRCKNGCLIDEYNKIYTIQKNLKITNYKGKTLSIIPINGDLEGIETRGLEYPLNNEILYFGAARGNSNVIISDDCEIKVKKGMGIVVIGNGE